MLVSNKRWDDAFALHSGGMQESNFSVQLIEREIEFENIDPEMLARKRQWNRLLPAVGFRIVNIVDPDGVPIFGGRPRCAAKRMDHTINGDGRHRSRSPVRRGQPG